MAERTTLQFDDDVWQALAKIRGESLQRTAEDIPVSRLVNDLLRKSLGLKDLKEKR